MLIESSVHLPAGFAMLQDMFHAPGGEALVRVLLRWVHFVAGITWIGLLYFFNLVNVPFQKGLDADTKKKVNPTAHARPLVFPLGRARHRARRFDVLRDVHPLATW